MKTEFDISEAAWKAYRLMYKNNFSDNFQIVEKGRKHIEEYFKNGDRVSKKKLFFSGDTDVNFTKGFAHSRLECYKDLIRERVNNSKYKNMYLNNLEVMEELTYSIVNISLIPQSGHLQAVKQGIGNDRIDTFIWALDEYFDGKSCLLFNHSAYGTLAYLKDYLGLFESVYDYCETIYHINESLVDDMIESGKQAIDSPERIIKFMNLVIRFWGQKYRYLISSNFEGEGTEIQEALIMINEKMNRLFDFSENKVE